MTDAPVEGTRTGLSDLPLLLKVPRVAAELSVHARTVYRLRDEGVLDAVPIGRHGIRITRESLLRFIRGES